MMWQTMDRGGFGVCRTHESLLLYAFVSQDLNGQRSLQRGFMYNRLILQLSKSEAPETEKQNNRITYHKACAGKSTVDVQLTLIIRQAEKNVSKI